MFTFVSGALIAGATLACVFFIVVSLLHSIDKSRKESSWVARWTTSPIKTSILRIISLFFGTKAATWSERSMKMSRLSGQATQARHVAIIMDGNRRYGREKYGDALKGHWDGGQTLVDTVRWCMEEGVQFLTVYAFSTENWKRDKTEVEVLMTIFVKYAERCEKEALENNIRIRVFCTERERLPRSVQAAIDKMERNTCEKTGFSLNLCVSYGSRGDIAMACQQVSSRVMRGELRVEDINEQVVAQNLVTRGIPDPDILIRTSGERRLSNYLLFELAYTELFFLDKFWPQVTKSDLLHIFEEYDARHRRYGA